jgi:hypothetical protein
VTDQNGRLVQRANLRLVVIDDLRQAQALDLVGVFAQLLDVPLLARPLGRGDRKPTVAEVFGEVLPASG